MQSVILLIRPYPLIAAMSWSENFTEMEEQNLGSSTPLDDSLGIPWTATKTAPNSNLSYHPSLPSQTLVPHQTSRDQVKGHVTAKEVENTGNQPSEKKRTIKRALAREHGRSIRLIPGFDHWSKALPKDLQHEDIIKKYPNHLRGELLLEIAATWTPKEISKTCGRPELTSNTLVKRIIAAKNKRDGLPRRSSKSTKALKTAHPPDSAMSSTQSNQTGVADPGVESEASLRFLTEQTELREIMMEIDPTWITRDTTARREKNPERDRWLVELAVQERQRRMNLAQENG